MGDRATTVLGNHDLHLIGRAIGARRAKPRDTLDEVLEAEDRDELVDWLRQHDANTGFRKMFVLFGVGNHGGGPSIEMMGRIDRLKTLDIFPSIDFGTAGEYLGWIKQQDLSKLPVWRDELYLEYHQGTFTTQAKTKEANRRSETLLTGAEAFSAIAALSGRPYGSARLEAAWRDVMFNQFHDILPGSSIRQVYEDAAHAYERIESIGWQTLTSALDRGWNHDSAVLGFHNINIFWKFFPSDVRGTRSPGDFEHTIQHCDRSKHCFDTYARSAHSAGHFTNPDASPDYLSNLSRNPASINKTTGTGREF